MAFAAVAAATAIWISRGFFGPIALALMTLAWLAAVASAVVGRRHVDGAPVERGARRFLSVALVGSCAFHVLLPPGMYLEPAQPLAFRALAALATLISASYLAPVPPALARWRFGALGLCFLVMAFVVLAASPTPLIDVWYFQQGAARAVLDGQNPYSASYPSVYGSARLFGPETAAEGRPAGFPYPPLTFLLGAPALLACGDVRFMLLAAVALSGWTLRRVGKGEVPELSALLLLLQPTTFFVLEQAWTEPIVLAAFGGSVLAMRSLLLGSRRGPVAVGVAGGLLAAAKQFAPLIAVPLACALPRGIRWRSIGLAAGVALATLLPFALLDPQELWRNVVSLHVRQPLRLDALSWLVPVAAVLRRPLSGATGFLAAGAVLAVTLLARSSLAQVVRASGAAFLSFVLFNKQAFCNYYWLAVGLLLFATALELDPVARAQPAAPGELPGPARAR